MSSLANILVMSWLKYYALVILLGFGGELGRSAENERSDIEKKGTNKIYVLPATTTNLLNSPTVSILSSFYRWTCVQQSKCVRRHVDNIQTFKEISYQSQNACRATCGRYGALWPRPTGATLLGQQLIAFHPKEIRYVIRLFLNEFFR